MLALALGVGTYFSLSLTAINLILTPTFVGVLFSFCPRPLAWWSGSLGLVSLSPSCLVGCRLPTQWLSAVSLAIPTHPTCRRPMARSALAARWLPLASLTVWTP